MLNESEMASLRKLVRLYSIGTIIDSLVRIAWDAKRHAVARALQAFAQTVR